VSKRPWLCDYAQAARAHPSHFSGIPAIWLVFATASELPSSSRVHAKGEKSMTGSSIHIDDRVLIPQLLRIAPQVRPVLDRYGLRGCGGDSGPVESLGFFARAHDVPLAQLLDELRVAAQRPESNAAAAASRGWNADSIYRPFFWAGIIVVLTLGATWGAYLLGRVAWHGSFTAAGLHDVNAHGHAQIFGWVGLFVMGFAFQAFPRFKHTSLAHPRLAYATLPMMLLGIVVRAGFEPLVQSHSWAAWPALAGSIVEIIAIGLFVFIITRTVVQSGKPLAAYDYYIFSALFWFVVQAVYETIYFGATVWAADAEALRSLVATWQGALRDTQIHGFAMLMILGVSQRVFPHFYGFPVPHARWSLGLLPIVNLAVVGECASLVLMQRAGHGWAALWYGSVLVLAVSVALLVRDWRIFAPVSESDRSLKFLRTAYAWLFVSLGLLVLLPGYQLGLLSWVAPESAAARMGFSHAYYGAIRHAITVGFVSLMIVGVAAKVVPTLNGVDVHALSGLWGPFVLLNVGCLLRVSGQILTDFTPAAFPFASVSGVLETLALAWWGTHLGLIMTGRIKPQARCAADAPASSFVPGGPIEANCVVGDILEHWPGALETFLHFGFRPLMNPVLRRTLARRVTIAQACRVVGVVEADLLTALNAAQARELGGRGPLPIV
jgi:hypothetical protein